MWCGDDDDDDAGDGDDVGYDGPSLCPSQVSVSSSISSLLPI